MLPSDRIFTSLFIRTVFDTFLLCAFVDLHNQSVVQIDKMCTTFQLQPGS